MGCCGACGRGIAEEAVRRQRWLAAAARAKLAREHRAQLLQIVDALRRLAERAHLEGRGTMERLIFHLRHFERLQRAAPACAEGAPRVRRAAWVSAARQRVSAGA